MYMYMGSLTVGSAYTRKKSTTKLRFACGLVLARDCMLAGGGRRAGIGRDSSHTPKLVWSVKFILTLSPPFNTI